MTHEEETITPRTESSEYLTKGTLVDGRYKVEHILGQGGYGVVYQATQCSTGQLVALKVLRLDRIQEQNASSERERFEREMKVIGQLNHVNIVKLIDFGTLPGNQLYSVIEYIHGSTLSDLLSTEGALHPKEALGLMTQILDAISAVHAIGIVYRDLKPQNIMVTAHSSRRSAKLLDFGISGILKDARDSSYKDLTQDGKINGTPSYMSPEQLRSKELTPQTDIYAWGLVFLEALLGRRVIDAESYVDVLAQQISPEPIVIPDELMLHPLGHILAKAVAKNLEDRYLCASDVLLDLEECIISPNMTLSTTGVVARQRLEESQANRSNRSISAAHSQNHVPWNTSSSPWEASTPQKPPPSEIPSAEQEAPLVTHKKRTPWLILLILLICGGASWAIYALLPSQDTTSPAVTPVQRDVATIETPPVEKLATSNPTVTPTATPKAPEKIHLKSQVSPIHATIEIDGKQVATGNLDLEINDPSESKTLTIHAKGYTTYRIDLHDETPPAQISLKKLPAHPKRPTAKKRPKTKKRPSAPKSSPKTTPKSSSKPKPSPKWVPKNIDLENPWAPKKK